MAAMTKDQMVNEIEQWLTKLENGKLGNRSWYWNGSIPADSTTTIDAPAMGGYTAATHHVYTTVVNLLMVDPNTTPTPGVIPSGTTLTYSINEQGGIVIKNNNTNPVIYHLRVNEPIRK